MGQSRERGEGSRVTPGAGTPRPGPCRRAIPSPMGTEQGGTGLPPTMGCLWLNPNSCVLLLLLALPMLQVSVSPGGTLWGDRGWWSLPVAPWRV